MVFIGIVGVVVLAVVVLAVAIVTLWSGWRAYRDELQPGFRSNPPGPRSIVLTVLGVVLPVLVIAAFTILTTLALFGLALRAM
jgi:heme/copper-type cytochrome/quinol oxidase subunit 2